MADYDVLREPIRDCVKCVAEIGIGTMVSNAPSSMVDWAGANYRPGASLHLTRAYVEGPSRGNYRPEPPQAGVLRYSPPDRTPGGPPSEGEEDEHWQASSHTQGGAKAHFTTPRV
jgi:hypothetical protein